MTYLLIAAAFGLGILTPKTYAKLKAKIVKWATDPDSE